MNYLDDARAVELSFRVDMRGIERIYIVRLGSAQDYVAWVVCNQPL